MQWRKITVCDGYRMYAPSDSPGRTAGAKSDVCNCFVDCELEILEIRQCDVVGSAVVSFVKVNVNKK